MGLRIPGRRPGVNLNPRTVAGESDEWKAAIAGRIAELARRHASGEPLFRPGERSGGVAAAIGAGHTTEGDER